MNATTFNTTSEQPNNHLREEQPACSHSIISNNIKTYSEVKILLKAWKLDNLNDLFETQKITLEVLEIIQDNEINELFQGIEIGYKAFFKHKLKLWRQQCIYISCSSLHSAGSVKSLPSTTSILQYCSSLEVNEGTVTLAEILNSNPESAIIEKYYSECSKLLCEHRNLLINIICGYFEENKLHLSLPASYNLEEEIVQRFPQEKIEYYRTGKRGKIYIKYSNSKNKIRVCKRAASTAIDPESLATAGRVFIPEPNAESCVRSLSFDNLSADEVDSSWQACSQFRLKGITEGDQALADIFKKWPQYKGPSGYRFIDKDFSILFGQKAGILDDWKHHFDKILSFLKDDGHIKDKNMRTVLEGISDSDLDSFAVKILWCLHGFFIPTAKAVRMDNNGKKSFTKFTIRSSQEAFCFVGNCVQEIEEHIIFMKSTAEHIQPFIIAEGEKDLSAFQNYMVYMDGVKFKFHKFLRALDVCFKIFHLFNLQYPISCSLVWEFISEYFYDIKSKSKSAKMIMILDYLNSNV